MLAIPLLSALATAPGLPPTVPAARREVQEAGGAGDPLAVAVLEQQGRTYSARDVVEAIRRWDPTLPPPVENDAAYRRLYLRSPRFLDQVQNFSNLVAVEEAGVPAVAAEQLLAEAAAWGADRGLALPADAVLALHGIEIEWRARLIAEQAPEFGTERLRHHMLASVPEFFGEARLSCIRVPLVNVADGSALPAEERRARYDFLDDLAGRLGAGSLTWEAAWEQAVDRYGASPRDRKSKGALGPVKRSDVRRFEEPLLRHAFLDLGYKRLDRPLLRGPILGELWAYLVRVESVSQTRGFFDLENVRPQVERSLRERLLRERLATLAAGLERKVLAPVFLE